MASTMTKINKKTEKIFNIVHVMDQVKKFKTILK